MNMASNRMRFSIGNLFALMLVCSFLIASFVIPKGYFVYLPFLIFIVLAYWAFKLIRAQINVPQELSFRNHWLLLVVGALLILSVTFYVPLFTFSTGEMEEAELERSSRIAAFNLENPEEFKSASLRLHEKLISLAPEKRTLSGSLDDVPVEIARLRPRQIIANQDFLFVKMTPNGSGIAVYVLNSRPPPPTNPGAAKIVDGVYYWKTP